MRLTNWRGILSTMTIVWGICHSGAAAAAKIEPDAQALLQRMGELYKNAHTFTAQLVIHHRVSMPGERQEAETSATLLAGRPGRLALKGQSPSLGGLYLDGRQLTLVDNRYRQYKLMEQPKFSELRDSPEVGAETAGGLALVLPLLAEDPYTELMRGVSGARIEGHGTVNGTAATAVVLEQAPAPLKLWIADGAQPALLRVAPDVQRMADQQTSGSAPKIESSVELRNPEFDTVLEAGAFKPDMPGGYERVQQFGPPEQSTNANTGGQNEQPQTVDQALKQMEASLKDYADQEANYAGLGKPAPELKLTTLEGKPFDLAEHKGKVVVVNLWATWCPPCVRELPDLVKVTKAFKPRGVEFYAIDQGEEAGPIKRFKADKKLEMNVVLDKDNAAPQALGAGSGIPFTVIINKSGNIVRMFRVAHANMEGALTRALEAVLAGKPVPTPQQELADELKVLKPLIEKEMKEMK